jgi:predicted nucleic acid-binding Zn ribbon protein
MPLSRISAADMKTAADDRPGGEAAIVFGAVIQGSNDPRYRQPAMPSKISKRPVKITEALQPLLDRLDTEGQFGIVRLTRMWPEIVGETIARRTQVASLKFHSAVVKVSGAMWIQELNLMKPQILSRIREAVGDDLVRDLRFVRGNLSRRDHGKLRAVPRAPRHAIELPEMKDPELKRAFERLIEAWGRAPR